MLAFWIGVISPFFKALTSDEGGCDIRREKMEGGVRLLMANGVLNRARLIRCSNPFSVISICNVGW